MSMRIDDYVTGFFSGVGETAGDITRSVISDVGNAYQSFLMANATVRPSPGLIGTMEMASYEMERYQPPTALEADPAPPIDVDY